MDNIDLLEHGGSDRFSLIHNGELVELPDPTEENYQWVLATISLRHVPGTPGDIPEWKRDRVFERWCAAYDLPTDFRTAQRLAYLVDHYRAAISSDLHTYAHLDLGELWRARRWTLILDVVDRLPAHSWYSATVSMDEEHARMMAESMASRQDSGEQAESTGPSLTTWTPEVAALTNILDAVRYVQHAVIAVNSDGKPPPEPKPSPRPITPLERALRAAEFARRKQKHESLVARVLPHKR